MSDDKYYRTKSDIEDFDLIAKLSETGMTPTEIAAAVQSAGEGIFELSEQQLDVFEVVIANRDKIINPVPAPTLTIPQTDAMTYVLELSARITDSTKIANKDNVPTTAEFSALATSLAQLTSSTSPLFTDVSSLKQSNITVNEELTALSNTVADLDSSDILSGEELSAVGAVPDALIDIEALKQSDVATATTISAIQNTVATLDSSDVLSNTENTAIDIVSTATVGMTSTEASSGIKKAIENSIKMIVLTQAEYDAIVTKDPAVFYAITE